MKSNLRRLLVMMLLGLLVLTAYTPAAHASTSSVSSPANVSFPANCYATLIHLNGSHPATIRCLIAGKRVHGKMLPLISRVQPRTQIVDCSNPGSSEYAAIYSVSDGYYCFAGTGYLGFHIIQAVAAVFDYTNSPYPLWFMYYKGGPGIKYPLRPSESADFTSSYVGITQMCINC